MDENNLDHMIDAFSLDAAELHNIAASFRYDIEAGLRGDTGSSLRMLKSYVGLPSGTERGEYLALDFGGTNVRALRVRLDGDGKFEILKKVAKPLYVPGIYDFISGEAEAADLFDFIAGIIDEAIDEDRTSNYCLGHTFSFPSEQTDLYNAKLIVWTKEFATRGVVGQVVNDLLAAALARNGISNVKPAAVINDTVAVLLAAAYKKNSVYIGSIYATGHNTCYLEPYCGEAKASMVINMESGGFDKIQINRYDHLLDQRSEMPGQQRLEKMVAGRYLGELFGLCLKEALALRTDATFSSIDLSQILADESNELARVREVVQERVQVVISETVAVKLQALAKAIVIRSGRIIAATYAGVIWHREGSCPGRQHIAIDGSVYEKMPYAAAALQKALYEVLGETAAVDTVLENGGSGLGAALAAVAACSSEA